MSQINCISKLSVKYAEVNGRTFTAMLAAINKKTILTLLGWSNVNPIQTSELPTGVLCSECDAHKGHSSDLLAVLCSQGALKCLTSVA